MSKSREVLNQNQIDALLSAIHSGSTTVEERIDQVQSDIPVNSYDFLHPSKFTREQVQTLHGVHETYARLLSTFLSTQMRFSVQIEVSSVDQLSYEEFIRSVTAPSVLLLYQLLPFEGNLMIEMPPITAISLIERMLGGPGRYMGRARELTDIEQSLVQNLMNQSMESYIEAWKNQFRDLKPELYTYESNPQFVQMAAPNDSVLVVSYSLRIGDGHGSMRLCLPYLSMEPMLNKKQKLRQLAPSTENMTQSTQAIQKLLDQVEVDFALILGKANITVNDLLYLQVGDVISLDSFIHQDLPITVESCCKYYGRPGRVGQQLAAQITAVVDGEESE